MVPGRRAIAAAPALLAALWVVLGIGALVGAGTGVLGNPWLHDALGAGAVAVVLARVVLVRAERTAWALVAAGLGAGAAAVARFGPVLRRRVAPAGSRRQALTDELTGLASRRALLGALAGPGEQPQPAALVRVDLDRFTEINDSLGHQMGDQLLVQFGRRLVAAAPAGALVARVGAGEFAVLMRRDGAPAPADPVRPGRGRPGIPPPREARPAVGEEALRVAERLVAAVEVPFALDDVTLHVRGSAGVGLLPEHTGDPQQLVQRAGVATRTARRAARSGGRRVATYRPDDDPCSRERLETLEELRYALRTGRVVCHFQPLVELSSGVAESVEALARWDHPSRGLVVPELFLPLAEQAGLMREVTEAVLGHALGQARRWRDQGLAVPVAVNLSPTNLLDVDLPEQIAHGLAQHGLPGTALRVEITETVLVTDFARSCQTLGRLRAVGVEAAIDDYGTGCSSLSYLQDLDVRELKLGRVFVSRLRADPRAAAIVRSTIDLSHSLGMQIVAEGVGDEETSQELRFLGCDLAQGLHYCRPLRGEVMSRWLVEHGGLVPSPVQPPLQPPVQLSAGPAAGTVRRPVGARPASQSVRRTR